jgi:hypothetical protein
MPGFVKLLLPPPAEPGKLSLGVKAQGIQVNP